MWDVDISATYTSKNSAMTICMSCTIDEMLQTWACRVYPTN